MKYQGDDENGPPGGSFLPNGRQSGQELISFYWRDVLPTVFSD
jgi:hypothetical protein